MRFFNATILLSVAIVAASAAFAKPPSVLIATGEYEPFTSEAASDDGLVNQIISQAFEEAGYSVTYEYMPWKRAIELTRRGDYTASSFWYYSKKREEEFIHAGPLFEERLVFFRLESTNEPAWDELSDLSGLKIGVVDGYTYTSELWDLGEAGKLTLERGPSDEANFKKLLAGRIDLFPLGEATGRHLLATKFTAEERERITISSKPLTATFGYLLVSRAHEDAEKIAADFDAALSKLRAEQAVSEVLQTLMRE